MPQWISPRLTTDDVPEFPDRLTVDRMLDLFEDGTLGWYLDIAEKMAAVSKDVFESRSGFAELTIVMNYFEMFAKFQDGYVHRYKSEEYFTRGFYEVFGRRIEHALVSGSWALPQSVATAAVAHAAKMLYRRVRCDLYHAATTGPGIVLDGSVNSPVSLRFEWQPNEQQFCCTELVINPGLLTARLKQHFRSYVAQLRDPSNVQLRANFESRFKYLLRSDRF